MLYDVYLRKDAYVGEDLVEMLRRTCNRQTYAQRLLRNDPVADE